MIKPIARPVNISPRVLSVAGDMILAHFGRLVPTGGCTSPRYVAARFHTDESGTTGGYLPRSLALTHCAAAGLVAGDMGGLASNAPLVVLGHKPEHRAEPVPGTLALQTA